MKTKKMTGYKVFNQEWFCKGFQYEVGKTYHMDGEIKVRKRGFHFCKKLVDCFGYYPFDPNNKVAEVEAYGTILEDDNGSKCCTNNITIVRELSWEEVLRLVNTGAGNTGFRNSGNRNTGNLNNGDENSGCRNLGNWNSGEENSGDRNSGDYNSGFRNSGDGNSGDWNSGDWNAGRHQTGVFNANKNPKIMLFDKPSEWTFSDWSNSNARTIMSHCPDNITWINDYNMTAEEREAHPECETIGGYLRDTDSREKRQKWWDDLSKKDKKTVMALPNFDPDIFEECTGIRAK